MDSFFMCILTAIASVFIGALFGSAQTNKEWLDDCHKMNSHRHGSLVIKCEVQKGTP